MKIKKIDLMEALNKVKVGLSDKAIIDQTDHFIFDNDYVRTYNDQLAISYPLQTGVNVAIKADGFYELICKVETEDIDINFIEDKIKILAGRTKAEIVVDFQIKCPVMAIGKNKEWKFLPKDFSDGIKFCSFSADKNMLLQELTCLWIIGDNVLSSDNWRATKFYMESKMEDSFLLPASAAEKLAKYIPVEYLLEESWVHFKNEEGAIFSSRIVVGVYPETVWGLFQVEGDEIKLPVGLGASIDRAKIFAIQDGSAKLISLSVQGGRMICKGEGPFGRIEEEYMIRCRTNFDVQVSPEALIEIVSRVDKMTVGDKLFFCGDNFEHVICIN